MNPTEVNGIVQAATRSDASPQIAGFLYQFVVALKYCFSLSPGQSLFLEKYGDVAIKNDGTFDAEKEEVSVEVKMYADELDVSHHNLLNTLYNWLEDDFGFEKYHTLIIYTTQPFSKGSALIGWEKKEVEERVKIISDTFKQYLINKKAQIESNNPKEYKTIKENAKKMKRVLGSVLKDDGTADGDASQKRLASLLDRVAIYDSCSKLKQSYDGLMDHAKVTTDNLRGAFINSLIGFIISRYDKASGWRITEEEFSAEVQKLAAEMLPQTITFPDPPDITVKDGEYDDALFVEKLKVIDYPSITDAIVDYAKTSYLISGEFKRPSAEKNFSDYQSELLKKYKNKYHNAKDELLIKGDVTDTVIKASSRILFRNMCDEGTTIKLAPYSVIKSYFSCGMCHYLANDSEQNVKWYLGDE